MGSPSVRPAGKSVRCIGKKEKVLVWVVVAKSQKEKLFGPLGVHLSAEGAQKTVTTYRERVDEIKVIQMELED